MRLIKRQTTNQRNITGKGVQYDINDQVILDSTNVMLVPKGTDLQRPTSPTNGHVRYNTTANELEAYQNNQWRQLRFKEPNQDGGIVWQDLGVGNIAADETVFGELQSNDPNFPVPAAKENILVLVENVLQIPGTNYSIQQTSWVNNVANNQPNAGSYVQSSTGWWIVFTSEVPLGKPVTVVHNFDK